VNDPPRDNIERHALRDTNRNVLGVGTTRTPDGGRRAFVLLREPDDSIPETLDGLAVTVRVIGEIQPLRRRSGAHRTNTQDGS
jgi:hypothetical protein